MKVERAGGGGADRLSNLPEELLYAVMSLLPAWQAVQTCVLSKRWRYLWTTMPCLHLEERLHLDEHRGAPAVFEDFASNLLLLHEAPALDSFRLTINRPSRQIVHGWIRYAVTRRPAALEIRNRQPMVAHLALPGVDCSRYLGRLRRLRLRGVRIDGRFAEKLGSDCCPALEDLELEHCRADFSKITLPVVKNLAIRVCGNDLLVVTAPALVCLSCQSSAILLLHDETTTSTAAASLVEASVYSRYIGCIRKLRLCDVRLNGRFAEKLGSDCPVLEDLELGYCRAEFSKITLPVVKNLTIRFCGNEMLIVSAPALVYLSCQGSTILLHETADSLAKASISLPGSVSLDIQRKLLGSLFNVTSLYLSDFETLAMLVDEPTGDDSFPVFHNLKTLSLEECFLDWSDWAEKFTALGSFVQNAPNLKKLSLCHCAFSAWEDNEVYETTTTAAQNQDLRPFYCDKLEVVEIKYWYDGDPRCLTSWKAYRGP